MRQRALPVVCDSHTRLPTGCTTIGLGPPANVRTTFAVFGSITTIAFASMHGTQSLPPTTAEPSGLRPTGTRASTFSVFGSTRATTFVSWDTQSEPAAAVTQSAPAPATEPVTRFVRGSMRRSLPAVWSVTQSAPPIALRPFGSTPTLIVFTTRVPVMRDTVPSPAFETHAEPNPHSTS